MSKPVQRGEIMSVYGPLRPIFFPVDIGALDPEEIWRAVAKGRFDLLRQDIEILECLAHGLSNLGVAERLNIASETTVKNRMRRLFRKLGVRNRNRAAAIGRQYGFGVTIVSLSQSPPSGMFKVRRGASRK
jgi:DNA-binding CsgD family transcriptional regulator